MSNPSSVLGDMIAVADEQVENLESSLEQVQEQLDDYNEQATGIEDGQCGSISDDTTGQLTIYLQTTKLQEIQITYPTAYLYKGTTYGSIAWSDPGPVGNVTDWEYRVDDALPAITYTVVYIYTPGDDSNIDKWVSDFSFGNDYLTKPFTDGATYGVYANITALGSALSLLNSNKSKIENSKTSFEDYT